MILYSVLFFLNEENEKKMFFSAEQRVNASVQDGEKDRRTKDRVNYRWTECFWL